MAEPKSDLALLRRLWLIMRKHKRHLVFALCLNVTGVLAVLAQPILLQQTIDKGIVPNDPQAIGTYAAILMLAITIGFAARSFGLLVLMKVGLRTLAALRRKIFVHVMAQGQRFFDRRTTGSLMTRTTNDVDAIYESLVMGAVNLITDALTIVGILTTMLILDWKLTLIAFSLSPVIVLVVEIFRRKLRTLSLIIRKALSRLNGYFAEQVYGMTITQTYGAQEQAQTTFRNLSYRYLDAYRKSNWWDAGLFAIMDGMSSLSVGLMVWYGAQLYTTPETGVTLGLLVAFVDYLGRIYIPIRDLSGRFATIQRAVAALERIFGLLDSRDQVTPGTVAPDTIKGAISFKDVSFRYSEERPQVLKNVSFDIAPGEVVAIVGATGSGKTTIGKVLTRMYGGYEGDVTIDGLPVSSFSTEALNRLITVVQQDVFLFRASVKENLSLWSEQVSEEALKEAATLAHADSFISEFEAGYDHIIEERGGNISSGQKQLLAITRALARNAPVVILDEATASVDSVTEHLIDSAIQNLLSRKTVLVIAHRLSTIRKADRIIVIHNGRVVESGTHESLMEAEGRYRLLVETSFAVT